MNQFAVSIVLILFPGIIAVAICEKVAIHSKWDSFKYSLYAFVLGIGTYAVLQIIQYVIDWYKYRNAAATSWTQLQVWSTPFLEKPEIAAWEVVSAAALSVPIAFLASWIINDKAFIRLAKRLRISNKFGDESLYYYYLNSNEIRWVYVRDLESKLTYQGQVDAFSATESSHELVLSEVTVYTYPESTYLYEIPTLYMAKPAGRFIIEAIPRNRLGASNGEASTD